MALPREIDGGAPLRPQPIPRLSGRQERRQADSVHMATGTLACPGCDAPVLPGPGRTLVGDPFSCAFCGQAAAVGGFLSLAGPRRPTRVSVRVRGLAVR